MRSQIAMDIILSVTKNEGSAEKKARKQLTEYLKLHPDQFDFVAQLAASHQISLDTNTLANSVS